MKNVLILIILVMYSCKNVLTDQKYSVVDSNYHPGMSNAELSLPSTFDVHSVGVNDQEVTINWDSSNYVSNYIVKYGISSGSYTTTVSENGSSPTTVTGLTNGVNYYFRVYAVNVNGTRTSTSELATMPMTAPSAPTSLAVSGATSHTIDLSWSNGGGLGTIKYNIYRSLTSGSGYSLVATNVNALTYSDTALVSNQTYFYLVTAVNAGGTSGYSNEDSALAP